MDINSQSILNIFYFKIFYSVTVQGFLGKKFLIFSLFFCSFLLRFRQFFVVVLLKRKLLLEILFANISCEHDILQYKRGNIF